MEFLIAHIFLDLILNEVIINSNSKIFTPFEEIAKEFEFEFPEYYDKLDLEYDQRDDYAKQFDFLMKSDKEANCKTGTNTTYFESKKFTEEVSNQSLNKWMVLEQPIRENNQIQILPESLLAESHGNDELLYGNPDL